MFKIADGLRYTRFLKRLHENCLFDWYMEIGCRDGRSFAPVRSKTIAVDPFFRAEMNIINAKPVLHVFQQKSDDFFETGFLARNKIKLSVSFLDGMHLIEFLLRDFINTEKSSDPSGVILMHDTAPRDAIMTMRDFTALPSGNRAWTGDVWKIWPILQEYRPDLQLHMLDCKPTGLMMVTGLNPKSTTLSKNYDKILAKWQNISLEEFGPENFANRFEFTDALQMSKSGFDKFRPAQLDSAAAKVPVFVSP